MAFNNLTGKIQQALGRVPLLPKVLGIALGTTCFLVACLFWQLTTSYAQLEEREVEGNARFIADVEAAGAAPLVRAGDLAALQRLLEDTARVRRAVQSIEVRDGEGRVLAQLTRNARGRRLVGAQSLLAGNPPGQVAVVLDDSHVNFEIAWHIRRLMTLTAVIGLVGVVASAWLMRLVIKPLRELAKAASALRAGDFHARARARAQDEVGQLAMAFNEMAEALQKKNAVCKHLVRKVIATGEAERKRISRELHDHTGQVLTSLVAGLTVLESESGSPAVTTLRQRAERTLDEVHDLSLMLRPSVLDDLGLVAALGKFCHDFGEEHCVEVEWSAIGFEADPRLPGEIELALYRIIQEALANAAEHGQPHSVEVLLHRRPGSVLAVIEDDGQGFDTSDWRAECVRSDNLGLLGMEERAAELGGTFRVESRPDGGTSLFIEIPIPDSFS